MITVLCLSGRASAVSAISRAATVYTLSIGTARGIGGGRPPDVESLRAKEVQRCADKGWKSALVCISNMRKGGVSPGTRAFNIALKACVEAGEWGRAVELLGDMRTAGVAANTTLSKMIKSTSSGGPEHQHDCPPRS